MKRCLYTVAIAAVLIVVGESQIALSAPHPQLFKEVSSYRANTNLRLASRSLRIGSSSGAIDLSILKEDFLITLGDTTVFGSVKNLADWSNSLSNPIETVSGMLLDKEGGSEIGTFAFSYDRISQDSIFGSFSLYKGGIFEITGSALVAQLHTLTTDIPECANNSSHVAEHKLHTDQAPALQPSSDTSTTIDVLVAYSPEAKNAAGSTAAIESEIGSAITLANTAYANSQVNISLRLIGTSLINTSESGSFNTDLIRLTSSTDGIWDDLHLSRNSLGVDLVVLLTNNTTSCGLGWVMSSPNVPDADTGFSVVSRQCISNYSFVHEIGHNMGAVHDQTNSTYPGVYSDSYGWRFTGGSGQVWRTVMAYSPGTRLNYFSNPSVLYDGVATGGLNVANNARTLNLTREIVAGYRSSSAAPTPIPNPTNTPTTETPTGAGGGGGSVNPPVPTPFELVPTPEPTTTVPSGYSFELRLQKKGNALHLVVGVTHNNEFLVTNQAIQLISTNNGAAQTRMLQSNGKARFKVKRGKSYQIEIDGTMTAPFKIRG